eukprot:Gb_15302 [translate_table: standard]
MAGTNASCPIAVLIILVCLQYHPTGAVPPRGVIVCYPLSPSVPSEHVVSCESLSGHMRHRFLVGANISPSPAVSEEPLGPENSDVHLEVAKTHNSNGTTHHHKMMVEATAAGGVIIGGLATVVLGAIFCYVRVTRRKSHHHHDQINGNYDENRGKVIGHVGIDLQDTKAYVKWKILCRRNVPC